MADETPLDPAQITAYFALMEVSSRLRYAVEQQLHADGGLSFVQFQILAGLSDRPQGSERMTDIADRLVYSRSALTYQIGRLEQAGLVRRERSGADERSSLVSITPAGEGRVRAILPGHVALVREQLIEPLSRGDLTRLTAILGRVQERMRDAPPRSARPRGGAG